MLTVSLLLGRMGWGRSRSIEPRSRSSHPFYLWRSRNLLVLPWDTMLNVLLLLLEMRVHLAVWRRARIHS